MQPERAKIYQSAFLHLINHLNRGAIWQIRPWEWGLQPRKSQVAWNRSAVFSLSSFLGISLAYFTRHFLVHLITPLSLVFLLFGRGERGRVLWTREWAEIRQRERGRQWEREGPGRCSDWWGGMMYVAAVSPLSSGPLSLIMAISFSLNCLVCSGLSKALLFSLAAHTSKGLTLLPFCQGLFFLLLLRLRH